MSLTKEVKEEIVKKFEKHEGDTGSSEVQVALLTARINDVTEHLKLFKKDYNSRRSLLKMVGRRRRLLNYLKRQDEAKFETVIKELNIRK